MSTDNTIALSVDIRTHTHKPRTYTRTQTKE